MTEFKRCSCQVGWGTREAFVEDPDVVPIGLTFLPDGDSENVYYFFNHTTCKSTLAVDSEDFADLIEGPVPPTVKAREEECEGHCTRKEDLEVCSVECRNAPFRRFFIDHLLKKSA
jgi:hypothetical protein